MDIQILIVILIYIFSVHETYMKHETLQTANMLFANIFPSPKLRCHSVFL